jgi:hypothetical protein
MGADLRQAATRAGAPVVGEPADRAGAELLVEMAAGGKPRPVLARLLRDALQPDRPTTSDSAREAGRWVGATPQQRGETLVDLLLLSDALPPSRASRGQAFPVLRSERI